MAKKPVFDCENCDWACNCELDPETNEDDMIQCYGIRQSLKEAK